MNDFSTSQGLEQAVKEAARKSGRPLDRVIEEYWRSRLLARIFDGQCADFALKGGTSVLARIPDARRTRDIDIASMLTTGQDEAIEEILLRSKKDMPDFCRFQLLKQEPLLVHAKGRGGIRLTFEMHLGTKRMNNVNIDLVFGCNPTGKASFLQPKNLEGFPLSDLEYNMYPLQDQIADKVSAIMLPREDTRDSSRTKDLVDLLFYATNESINMKELSNALLSEMTIRNAQPTTEFCIPDSWYSHPERYQRAAREYLSGELLDLKRAVIIAQNFINPALRTADANRHWNPRKLKWQNRTSPAHSASE